jgi:hypothetical protein
MGTVPSCILAFLGHMNMRTMPSRARAEPELIRAVTAPNAPASLQIPVGIVTGPVVVARGRPFCAPQVGGNRHNISSTIAMTRMAAPSSSVVLWIRLLVRLIGCN